MNNKNIAVLGASDKPERYSNRAVKMLLEKGYRVFPVHPRVKTIENQPAYPTLGDIPEPIHTVTLYIGSARMERFTDELIALAPERVIFNPGTENELVESRLRSHNISTVRACTLVMLSTGQF